MVDNFAYALDPRQFVVCGIDEAGRGPLMGDVVAACVWLSHDPMIEGLNDSKKLSEHKREELAVVIKEQALAYGIGRASPQEIDKLNILKATELAMTRAFAAMQSMRLIKFPDYTPARNNPVRANAALAGLEDFAQDDSDVGPRVDLVLIDGNRVPSKFVDMGLNTESVVKGDARVCEIAAASILAKTTRDADLIALDQQYPEYGFAQHKGYPTPEHLKILKSKEILPCYRRSFGPVRDLIQARAAQTHLPQQGSLFDLLDDA